MNEPANNSTPAEILFSDKNLLLFNKRPGVTVIPGRGETTGISLREWAEQSLHEKLFVVHRIDRDTSGIVLFCRNAEWHRALSLQFERRVVKKSYLALVEGVMSGEGELNGPVHQFGSGRMGVDVRGKPSTTRYTILETLNGATLLNVNPLSGRRHQIRVHLFHHGHPVMGDRLYGLERPVGGVERLMLHAAALTFAYPGDVPFTAQAPVDFRWNELVGQFRGGRTDGC